MTFWISWVFLGQSIAGSVMSAPRVARGLAGFRRMRAAGGFRVPPLPQ